MSRVRYATLCGPMVYTEGEVVTGQLNLTPPPHHTNLLMFEMVERTVPVQTSY